MPPWTCATRLSFSVRSRAVPSLLMVLAKSIDVVPFMTEKRRTGLLPFAWELVSSTARVNVEHLLELGQRHTNLPAVRVLLDKLHSVATQSYSGDITLFPEHQSANILRTLADPSPEHVADFIADGERATWPSIERIRNATRISCTLDVCLARLKAL